MDLYKIESVNHSKPTGSAKIPARERKSFWGGLIIFRLAIFIIVIYVELLFTNNRLYDEPIDWNEMMKVKMDGMLIVAALMIVMSFSN